MAKREFLMLAHKYNSKKHFIGGWYASEKLDGQRCFWDGGVTRGVPKALVPWANTDKDERYTSEQICTGLWSRYGNVIHAPEQWLNGLPSIMLDGELYMSDYRQQLRSIISRLEPNIHEWREVTLHVFDSPYAKTVFADGIINNTNMKVTLRGCVQWFEERGLSGSNRAFMDTCKTIEQTLEAYPSCVWHPQEKLPLDEDEARARVEVLLDEVVTQGGEGLILRDPASYWTPERSHRLLKVKPCDDAEGTVIGYITGRQTDLGSKLLGRMGALVLKLDNGRRMELSGFTDSERELFDTNDPESRDAYVWACQHPGEACPDWIEAAAFPRGSRVTFKYRGKSREGIPQEARYWRKRGDE